MNTPRVILATDELSLEQCLLLSSKIGDRVYAIKIHNLFDQEGPSVIQKLKDAGARRVWVDAKLHDIPNTVRFRTNAIVDAGADIISVHASGGMEMMRMAVQSSKLTEIYAVTALTSLDEKQISLIYGRSSQDIVLYLAGLAKLAGVHGMVCSSKEVGFLAKRPELEGLKFITPGVRSAGKAVNDQKRTDTPRSAVASGATHLVIGREITQAADPLETLRQIEEEISEEKK
jgi:orotidine-5'-phosphate decarboxylase